MRVITGRRAGPCDVQGSTWPRGPQGCGGRDLSVTAPRVVVGGVGQARAQATPLSEKLVGAEYVPLSEPW
ncbi:hypothetical protein GA0070216_11790 [Micromonospora matsumotoense]|uniref:Uncharacterized protein n=1 Tax=Micromonospora matsumotoense TaxID=121616 RepID=A0A1C5AHJ3_9ACTN|nr:hypothetical protein GA0070216_11790 [Micromonospora matsumotoense]